MRASSGARSSRIRAYAGWGSSSLQTSRERRRRASPRSRRDCSGSGSCGVLVGEHDGGQGAGRVEERLGNGHSGRDGAGHVADRAARLRHVASHFLHQLPGGLSGRSVRAGRSCRSGHRRPASTMRSARRPCPRSAPCPAAPLSLRPRSPARPDAVALRSRFGPLLAHAVPPTPKIARWSNPPRESHDRAVRVEHPLVLPDRRAHHLHEVARRQLLGAGGDQRADLLRLRAAELRVAERRDRPVDRLGRHRLADVVEPLGCRPRSAPRRAPDRPPGRSPAASRSPASAGSGHRAARRAGSRRCAPG